MAFGYEAVGNGYTAPIGSLRIGWGGNLPRTCLSYIARPHESRLLCFRLSLPWEEWEQRLGLQLSWGKLRRKPAT